MKKQIPVLNCTDCFNQACLFKENLQEDALQEINLSRNSISYKKGQYIFYEDTRPQSVFCVFKGKVKVLKIGADGKEQIIYLAGPGEILGVKSVFSNAEYTSSACTLEDSVICNIPQQVFLNAVQNNSLLHSAVIRHLCRMMEIMEKKVLNLSQRTVRERLALNILLLNDYFGTDREEERLIDISLTREDLASLVGTATETVIRLLSEFRREGMVDFKRKKMTITNLNHLKRAAELYF